MNSPENSVTQDGWRMLRRSERASAGDWRRLASIWMHTVRAGISDGSCLERLLAEALRESARPFAVPLPYAWRGLGQDLCTTLPAQLLQWRIADWVQCGASIVHVGDYFVSAFDWESIIYPFAHTGVMREAVELLEHGSDYRATPSYARYCRSIEERRPIRRNQIPLNTTAMIDAYFERYLALFSSIEAYGILPLREARKVATGVPRISSVRRSNTEARERDIGIAINADGSVLALPGGKHRAAIAMVLGLSEVPVEVRLVHRDWIKTMQRRHDCDALDAIRTGVAELAHG